MKHFLIIAFIIHFISYIIALIIVCKTGFMEEIDNAGYSPTHVLSDLLFGCEIIILIFIMFFLSNKFKVAPNTINSWFRKRYKKWKDLKSITDFYKTLK